MTDVQLQHIRDGFVLRVKEAFEAERGKPLVRTKKNPPLKPGRSNLDGRNLTLDFSEE